MNTRRKFTSKFKTKVVLEILKERSSLAELAQKYEFGQPILHRINLFYQTCLDAILAIF